VSSIPLRTQSTALNLARQLLDRTADPLRLEERGMDATLLTLKRPGALCDAAPTKAVIERLFAAAELTLAHLAPELRRALWVERRWLDCSPGRLSPKVRRRFELYAAIASRDAHAMLARARALLEDPADEGGPEWGQFLLLAAMVGARASDEHEEADRLWRTYGPELYSRGVVPPHVVYVVNLSRTPETVRTSLSALARGWHRGSWKW
jgi:hypothetical protein